MSTATQNKHIDINPAVMDGKPIIKGHRISVKDVVIWHERMGQSADEIATQYGLSLSDVYAALTYYYDHQQEIDSDIRESDQLVDQLRKAIPSKIIRK
jgi:uncharacterized protein (DUF433 family)